LLMLGARLDESNALAASSAEPAFLAKYTFNLAKAFNLFYHRHRIIGEEDEVKRAVLVAVTDYIRRQLTTALATLGIQVPERMYRARGRQFTIHDFRFTIFTPC